MGSALNYDFCYKCVYYKKLGRRLKLLVPKHHLDPSNGLGDIPENVYTAELKPTVGFSDLHIR